MPDTIRTPSNPISSFLRSRTSSLNTDCSEGIALSSCCSTAVRYLLPKPDHSTFRDLPRVREHAEHATWLDPRGVGLHPHHEQHSAGSPAIPGHVVRLPERIAQHRRQSP